MQCRHFTIRLSPQHLIEDEERLNVFLRQAQVISVQTAIATPKGERWSLLVFFEEPAAAGPPAVGRNEIAAEGEATPLAPELTAEEQRIYERLRAWRSERSRAEGIPPYVVAHNAALIHIARRHTSLAAAEDLAPIKKFGAQKAARYGPEILRLIRGGQGEEDELFEDNYAR